MSVCPKCGSQLPGPNKCCDDAINRSYAAREAASTRAENGTQSHLYGNDLSRGFDMMSDDFEDCSD